jgi:hypothetical protein
MMLAIGLSYITFTMLRYIPSIPSFIRALSWNGIESYWRLFLCLLRWSTSFYPCFCYCVVLHLMICICWTIPASLMKQTWSWCMIFPVCCWIRFAIILLMIFVLLFIKEIGL